MNSEIITSMFVAFITVLGLVLLLVGMSQIESKRKETKEEQEEFEKEIEENLIAHNWRSLRLVDAIVAGCVIKYVNIKKNNVVIQTPEGIVEAKVRQEHLPFLLYELKTSSKTPYRHTDVYINLDMDNQQAVIDNIKYA